MRRAEQSGARAYSSELAAEILLARILELPASQQLRVHEALEEMLGEERLGIETERSRQVRARRDAVQAMREAAAHLGLAQGQAPGVAEFKRAARETSLRMGFNSVYAAFDKRWELATRFYEGMPIPLTAAQRRIQRTSRRSRQDPIVALRLWWAETSPGRDAPASDYRDWAVEQNERWPAGWKRVAESPRTLCRRLGVSWMEALALACGEKTLDEAQRDSKEARLREAGPLVARVTAREMLGLPRTGNSLWEADFPNPVARLYAQPLWRVEDVRAYVEGKRDFAHPTDALRHLYMDDHAVAGALDMDTSLLRKRLAAKSVGAYARIPPPAGTLRYGQRTRPYWHRPDVERWVESLKRRRGLTAVSLGQRSPRRRAYGKRHKG
jgi:hypothetical protein